MPQLHLLELKRENVVMIGDKMEGDQVNVKNRDSTLIATELLKLYYVRQ